jgi:hypothetical protein
MPPNLGHKRSEVRIYAEPLTSVRPARSGCAPVALAEASAEDRTTRVQREGMGAEGT